MDYLRRHTAPVSERIWHALDEAVAQAARHVLAARRIATFDGPHGWEYIAARLGTMTPCGAPPGRAVVCVPNVVLLSEIRVEFSLPWSSIEVFLPSTVSVVRRDPSSRRTCSIRSLKLPVQSTAI